MNLLCVFVVLTMGILFWHEDSSARQREYNDSMQAEVLRQQRELPDLLRTMPPTDFLNLLGASVDQAMDLVRAPAGDTPAKIRSVLSALATLAKAYDGGPAEAPTELPTYAANLMLFTGQSDSPWLRKIRFDGDLNPNSRRGVLSLPSALSVTSHSNGAPDEQIQELSLPVPKHIGQPRVDGAGGWRVLPGAPSAFARKQFEFVADTAELKAWFVREGHFLEEVQREVLDYFAKNRPNMRGFLAVPVYGYDDGIVATKERNVAAVLNIHWNTSGRFRSSDAARLFANGVYPLISALSALLESYTLADPS